MSTIATTDLRTLEAALAALIATISPTYTEGASEQPVAWVYAEDGRELAPTMVARLFSFSWGRPKDVRGGCTGNNDSETEIEMRVVTDYRVFREEILGTVVESDFWDLHDVLAERLHPLVTGLMWIEPIETVAVDEAAQRIAHVFSVQYMRARRS